MAAVVLARRTTVRWRTLSPIEVDEELAVYADGAALLVLAMPLGGGSAVGTWVGHIGEEATALDELGPVPYEVDPLDHERPPVHEVALAAADRAARAARERPESVASFSLQVSAQGVSPSFALLVVGSGTRAVQVELDPAACLLVWWHSDDQPVGSSPLPPLAAGFMTPQAEGLGGVGRPTLLAPGAYGALAFDAAPPAGATHVAARVAGWLTEALPDDDRRRRPFLVDTAAVPLTQES